MFYNWNVIGHVKELIQLEQDFTSNNIPHAYLFVGPEKVGKFRVAKSIAGILQCPNSFCHTCPTCIQIEKKSHPDTIELEDDGESIKIDLMREIIARLNMTGQSKYKVLLIQNIGRLTEEATNSILKTLEEPPGRTLFLFSAGQLRDVKPTIASRMRVVHFKKLPDEILKQSLKEMFPEVTDELIAQVLFLSLGRSGKAIQLLRSPEVFKELLDLYHQIEFLDEKASVATRFSAVNEIAKDPGKLKSFMSLLIYYFRKKMFEQTDYARKQAAMETLKEIHNVINLLSRNVNQKLALEYLMLKL